MSVSVTVPSVPVPVRVRVLLPLAVMLEKPASWPAVMVALASFSKVRFSILLRMAVEISALLPSDEGIRIQCVIIGNGAGIGACGDFDGVIVITARNIDITANGQGAGVI